MAQLSNRLNRLAPSATLAMSQKSSEMKAQGIDVINMSVGEPDFNTPDHIKEAAKKAIDENYSRYSPVPGYPELRKAIVAKLKNENGLEYGINEILVSNGAKQSVCNTVMALCNDGDEVIIPAPYWVSYPQMAKLAGAEPVIVNAGFEQNFKMTPEQLEAAITPKTRMLILCSPSNPTGSVYSQEELDALAKVILSHEELYVLADEIYEHINYVGKHASIAKAEGMRERTIIVNGVSKAYAMTGWRLGYCMANKELSSVMNKIHQYVIMSAPVMSQYAGIEAIKNGYDDVLMMKDDYLKRRNFLVNRLNRMGLKTNMPHGTFYVFCNIQSTGLDSETFCERLLQEQKVACVPGNAFGESGEGYIRISYAYSIDHIKEAVVRLEQFLKDLDK